MPNHMIFMSFDDSDYKNLNYTLNRFFEYSLNLLQKKNVNFCYIGTASNDSIVESMFFNGFVYSKFFHHIKTSKLTLTAQLTPQQIEEHIRKQDMIFVGGGNTDLMLKIWESKGFPAILNKLKAEDKLPLLAGVSAGGMYPFHSGLSDYIPRFYTPLRCLGWLPYSFCAHADSKEKAMCAFDNNQKRERLPAYIEAIKLGKLPEGYAVPNNCMLHFYNEHLVQALSSFANVTCSYVSPEELQPIETTLLGKENSSLIAYTLLKKLNLAQRSAEAKQELIHANRCAIV